MAERQQGQQGPSPPNTRDCSSELLTLAWERLKHQHEMRDRWFRYSLLVLAVPVGLVGAKLMEPGGENLRCVAGVLLVGCAVLGYGFFRLYVAQRINGLRRVTELLELIGETNSEYARIFGWKGKEGPRRKKDAGADFWANVIQMSINSVLLSFGALLLAGIEMPYAPGVVPLLAVVVLALMFLLQYKQRPRLQKEAYDARNKALQALSEGKNQPGQPDPDQVSPSDSSREAAS